MYVWVGMSGQKFEKDKGGGGGGEAKWKRNEDFSLRMDRLVGLVVKASASRAEGPGFESR